MFSGEGNGTPLQYSCLENPLDGGAWWAAVHGVPRSQAWLSDDFAFTFTFRHWRRKWQPTPVFLPGESQGWQSLVGCHLWGRTESDTTEATQQQQHQDVFHSKLQKAWINVAQNTYYLLQKSLVRSQFLGVNLVPHHVVWSPLFPPFSLHTLLSSMYPQSLSECSSSFSTSCSTSITGKKKMDSFLFCVSCNQRGTHFLDALKKMSLQFYWPELCHMPMTNLVTGKG